MSLREPLHDFLRNSIEAVDGRLNRLSFLGSLRGQGGDYEHWGMERRYGIKLASNAMSTAHSLVWLDTMRTKIQDLEKDSADEIGKVGLFEVDARMIPENTAGAIPSHFNFLVHTLNLLFQHQR